MPGDRGYIGRRRCQGRASWAGRPIPSPEYRRCPAHRRPATGRGAARAALRGTVVLVLSVVMAGALMMAWPAGRLTSPSAEPDPARGSGSPGPSPSDATSGLMPSPVALATRVLQFDSPTPALSPSATRPGGYLDPEAAPVRPDVLALAGVRPDQAGPSTAPSASPAAPSRPIEVLTSPDTAVGPVADIPVGVDPALASRAACIVLDPESVAMPNVYPAFPVVPERPGRYGCAVAFPGTPVPGHRYAVQAVLVDPDFPLALAYGTARLHSLPASVIDTASDPVEVVIGG